MGVPKFLNQSEVVDYLPMAVNGSSLTKFLDQFEVVNYIPMAVNAVQVLSADTVPPARACTAFECTYSIIRITRRNRTLE